MKLTSLRPDQSEMVRSSWKYSGPNSGLYIKHMIETLPSACLYTEKGDVMGYALCYHYGFIGMLYVVEEYRGKGYAKVIISHLAYTLLKNEDDALGSNTWLGKRGYTGVLIDESNTVSIKLHERVGFKIEPDVLLIWITA